MIRQGNEPVIVLQQAVGRMNQSVRPRNKAQKGFRPSADKTEAVKCVDERLADLGVVRKGSDAELTAGNRQIER